MKALAHQDRPSRRPAPPPCHHQRSDPGLQDNKASLQENVFQNNVTMHFNSHLCFLEAGLPVNITETCSLPSKSPYVKLGSYPFHPPEDVEQELSDPGIGRGFLRNPTLQKACEAAQEKFHPPA